MWFITLLIRLPRFFVWTIDFSLEMIIYWTDRLVWKILFMDKRSRYVRHGACRQSGVCCEAIGIEVPKSWIYYSWMVHGYNAYQRWIHHFKCQGIQNENMLVYTCGYFKNRRCSIHPFRPKLCREYPLVTWAGHSKVQPRCGFSFRPRKGHSNFQKTLEEKRKNY